MESILTPAIPVSPPAPWFGGKRLLADRIIQRIAAFPHVAYVEPFIGMGGVFLRRPFRAKAEVINDLSQDVANLFRILQRHYVPLMDFLRWQLTSRTEFDRLRAADPSTLTDIERAARFLYLQRTAFSGLVRGVFAVDVQHPARFDVSRLGPILDSVHQRLAGVVIERLPYAELIQRYDRPATLFYLDPPYWGRETVYGPGLFNRSDFQALADLLAAIKGRFILSINDRPEIREMFAFGQIETLSTVYSGGSKANPRVTELLISSSEGA